MSGVGWIGAENLGLQEDAEFSYARARQLVGDEHHAGEEAPPERGTE